MLGQGTNGGHWPVQCSGASVRKLAEDETDDQLLPSVG